MLIIQIDHLLISKSGIILLEAKNWSNKSKKHRPRVAS
jgi:hypothetical protein